MRPIEIIGGGLAGLSLGLALRRFDVPVTILEAGTYPRHRVCGEFITGLDTATITTLGLAPLLDDSLRHHEVAWFLRDAAPRIQRLPEPALGISRHVLDERLAHAFVEAGGALRTQTRASDLRPAPGRVLANGRHRGHTDWIGLKVHLRALSLTRDLEMHLGRDAYVGLSRIGQNLTNVCGLFQRRRRPPAETQTAADPGRSIHATLTEALVATGLPELAERLRHGEPEPGSFCAVAALQFGQPAPVRGAVQIGDAFAMTPPFTGNGMAMAFQSAVTVVAPLLAYARGEAAWTDACRISQSALRRRFRVRLRTANWIHPFLLRPDRQTWFASLSRARLLPFRALYALVHA